MNFSKLFILVLFVISFFTLSSFQTVPTESFRLKNFHLEKGLALEGYDPVSYFKNSPKEGSTSIAAKYLGVIYRFASQENKATFSQNPEKYLPQYGGWCAYAMGKNNEKVSVNPKTYKIVNGKLYLFYNAYFTNTLTDWNKDEANLLNKANQNWSKVK